MSITLSRRTLPSLYTTLHDDAPVVTDASRLAQFEQNMVAAMAALTRAKCCLTASEGSVAVGMAHSAAWSARDAVLNLARGSRA